MLESTGQVSGEGRRLLKGLGPTATADDGRTESDHLQRGLPAQPGTGPGKDNHLSFEQAFAKNL